jgi:CMP/dCMP kinase
VKKIIAWLQENGILRRADVLPREGDGIKGKQSRSMKRGSQGDVITIDGPAGSGKSTISKLLARRLGFLYLDTGAMYRAVALQAGRAGIEVGNPAGLAGLCAELDLHFEPASAGSRLFIGEEDVTTAIRTPAMDLLSSAVSAVREVREAMTALQRKIGVRGRLVAEGRDMGTVVFPEARHKFFLTASAEVRAERRYRERVGRGESVVREEVERELRRRDEQDSRRMIAPLTPAADAVIVDTSELDPEQVVGFMLKCTDRR